MTRSSNEVMTLAEKAARGAGAPAGQAAAFGRAALRHLIAERDWADLAKALEALPKGPIVTLPLAFSHFAEQAISGPETFPLPPQKLAVSYAEAQPYLVSIAEGHITVDATRPAAPRPIQRLELPDAFAHELERLAAKTRVPETAASRLSGAGAGLTDND